MRYVFLSDDPGIKVRVEIRIRIRLSRRIGRRVAYARHQIH